MTTNDDFNKAAVTEAAPYCRNIIMSTCLSGISKRGEPIFYIFLALCRQEKHKHQLPSRPEKKRCQITIDINMHIVINYTTLSK